jgi:hypothetical protein
MTGTRSIGFSGIGKTRVRARRTFSATGNWVRDGIWYARNELVKTRRAPEVLKT